MASSKNTSTSYGLDLPESVHGGERKAAAQTLTPSELGQLSLKTEGQFNLLSSE